MGSKGRSSWYAEPGLSGGRTPMVSIQQTFELPGSGLL